MAQCEQRTCLQNGKRFVFPPPAVFDPTVFVLLMGLNTLLQTKQGHRGVFFSCIFLDEGEKKSGEESKFRVAATRAATTPVCVCSSFFIHGPHD